MDVGWVPAVLGVLLLVGTGIFVLACRWSAGGPVRAADARRIARLRRAVPLVVLVSAALVAVSVGWALVAG